MAVQQGIGADGYKAVVPVKASQTFRPGRNSDDGDLTAAAQVVIAMSATDAGTAEGYDQVTATGAAFALPAVPAAADSAVVQAEAQALRWRDDGTAPTATVGMLIPAGTSQTFQGDLSTLRFIAATAGAILNVSYYG
jgi:hypothetical protein